MGLHDNKISQDTLLLLKDKEWRLSNLYKIVDKEGHLTTFHPNRAQRSFLRNKHNRNIVLKSRRLGMTTFSVIDMLDNTLFNRNFESLFISYDEPSSKKVFDTIALLAWEHFPLKQLYKIDMNNANTLKLEFGDRTFSTIEIKSSARGGRTNQIHISEFGKICAKYPLKEKEIIAGTIPSLVPHGEITIESTAEGDEGIFHDMFWDAWNRPKGKELNSHEYKAHFFNWQWDDWEIGLIKQADKEIPREFKDIQKEHNEKAKLFPEQYAPIDDLQLTYWFYKWVELGKRWSRLLQEYPLYPDQAFLYSGSKLFDSAKLEEQKKYEKDGSTVGSWIVYYEPEKYHDYVLSADPSEGVGRDHSAAVIWDFTPKIPRVAAIFFNNHIAPDVFAYELETFGVKYNDALVMVERNNHGHATLTRLRDIYDDRKIYKMVKQDRIEDVETEKMGWETNLVTKPKMMYELSTAINDGLIEIPSAHIIREMKIFDRGELSSTKSKDEDNTKHFDLLMATAIGFQGRTNLSQRGAEIITILPTTKKRIHSAI